MDFAFRASCYCCCKRTQPQGPQHGEDGEDEDQEDEDQGEEGGGGGEETGETGEETGEESTRAHLIPSVLESQKSSKRARRRGGVAPSCQPRKARSDETEKRGSRPSGGGASPMMSASDFEKLFVSAITRHLPAAASSIACAQRMVCMYACEAGFGNGHGMRAWMVDGMRNEGLDAECQKTSVRQRKRMARWRERGSRTSTCLGCA